MTEELLKILENPDASPTREQVEQWSREYPYCTLPAILFLKHNGTEGNEDLVNRLALMVPDRRELAMQIDGIAKHFAEFYPAEPEPETPDTDATIDRFLASYGNTSQKEIDALSATIFNPTPDYADVLAAQEQEQGGGKAQPQSEEDRLINEFIEKSQEREREASVQAMTPEINEEEKAEIAVADIGEPDDKDDSMLSESLAKFYISQHKYSSALEIIENINLKFPEKSIYFADQIRFLRKIIVNEQYINKKQ
mgnify:CR=1 FL=1